MNKCGDENKDWYIRKIKDTLASSWHIPPVHCVDYNSGPFGDMKAIAEDTCRFISQKMDSEEWKLKDGVVLIGLSQGGLIARYIVEGCYNVSPHVLKLLTIGTPNNGISQLPNQVPNPMRSLLGKLNIKI